jgi:hypothetical protein
MMFEALILICMSGELDDCSIIEDTRGPYPTFERCMDRTIEMSAAMLSFDEDQIIMGAKCKPVQSSKPRFSAT